MVRVLKQWQFLGPGSLGSCFGGPGTCSSSLSKWPQCKPEAWLRRGGMELQSWWILVLRLPWEFPPKTTRGRAKSLSVSVSWSLIPGKAFVGLKCSLSWWIFIPEFLENFFYTQTTELRVMFWRGNETQCTEGWIHLERIYEGAWVSYLHHWMAIWTGESYILKKKSPSNSQGYPEVICFWNCKDEKRPLQDSLGFPDWVCRLQLWPCGGRRQRKLCWISLGGN